MDGKHPTNMAANIPKYPLGSPQEHIKMCRSHDLPIDVICEDCDEFICGECAKTDHRNHDWKTIPTAATQRRRGLLKFLTKIKEEDMPGINEQIEKTSKQITENKELCDYEIKKLQEHYDEIIFRLSEVRKYKEQTLTNNLKKKNEKLNGVKSELNKKKEKIDETVQFVEENNSTMSDYSLIDNHRELKQLLSGLDVDIENCKHSVRYSKGEIRIDVLENISGKTLDLDYITLTETNSSKYGDEQIVLLKASCEDHCYIRQLNSGNIEQVNKEGEKKQKFKISLHDMCVADTGDVYFTVINSISLLSPSGSVSTVISTDPLVPGGISQSEGGEFLITLIDKESDPYKLESNSRRLVRHVTVTGDVIDEYEYKEDGQTRLFTLPFRVTQNRNGDICVVNHTSLTTGNLVVMSPSGRMNYVYSGKNQRRIFYPRDVMCDSLCNILVTDFNNNQIHLLSPDGMFLKFLLTENEVHSPVSSSLCNSTLWMGYSTGLVKVFRYRVLNI